MDLTRKQYEKMMSNKPGDKQPHHSLATMMSGAKRTASQERIMKMQGRVSSSEKSERRHSAKSKALDKVKHLKVYSNKASYHFSPSKAQVSTEHGRKEAEKSGRKMYHNRMSFNK